MKRKIAVLVFAVATLSAKGVNSHTSTVVNPASVIPNGASGSGQLDVASGPACGPEGCQGVG